MYTTVPVYKVPVCIEVVPPNLAAEIALPYRIRNISHRKELLKGLWVKADVKLHALYTLNS